MGEDAVYRFINIMTEEIKYCTDMVKKQFNDKLVMTKEDNEDFENSENIGFAIMFSLMVMLK